MSTFLYTLMSRAWGPFALAAGVAAIAALLGLAARHLKSRRLLWIARIAGLATLILTLGAGAGSIRRIAAERNASPPGRLVDVGGHRMHLVAEGAPTSRPTVVWIPGGHAPGLTLYPLHRAVRQTTRSILFDRPGSGWSDPGPFPRSTAREARELAALLEAAGEEAPFLLVGHSYGGLLAVNFARRYPDRTHGLVLLDPSHPDAFVYPAIFGWPALAQVAATSRRDGWLKSFGLWSPPEPPDPETDPLGHRIATALADVRDELDATRFRAAADWSRASIFEEFGPGRFHAEAPSLIVYDGALEMPVWLVVPAEVTEVEAAVDAMGFEDRERRRILGFFREVRLRYRHVSTNTQVVHPPAGVGHNFPYEVPDFVVDVVRTALEPAPTPGGH